MSKEKYVLQKTTCFIGMPGSGKSTLVRLLGKQCNLPVIDLDEYIEHEINTSISNFWNSEGEKAFRCIERFCLIKVLSKSPVVLSCGGGTPCFFDNMSLIKTFGFSIYLKSNEPRLTEDIRTRVHPMFRNAANPDNQWKNILKQRSSIYEMAEWTLNVNKLEPKIVEDVSKHCLDKGIITIESI